MTRQKPSNPCYPATLPEGEPLRWVEALLACSSDCALLVLEGDKIWRASEGAAKLLDSSSEALAGQFLRSVLFAGRPKEWDSWLRQRHSQEQFRLNYNETLLHLRIPYWLPKGDFVLVLGAALVPPVPMRRMRQPNAPVLAPDLLHPQFLQTEKMAALGQLVSGIAHELNSPLTGVMGYAQLLLRHHLNPAQASDARKIYQEAERARRIVRNLLYFAREAKPERAQVNLNEVVARTLALQAYELKMENIIVEPDLLPSLPPILADPYQLQQVVLNLLVNAEQAILGVRARGHIWLRTSTLPNNRIRLRVSDDGPGASPATLDRIFEPFFTTKPPGIGTGLGLSIVFGIVRQHGGTVTAQNRAKGGLRIDVELPVLQIQQPKSDSALSASPRSRESNIRRRLLVVEDEAIVGGLIGEILRAEGFDVDIVLDGKEALHRLATSSYDLVISDLRMPGMEGPSFYDALVKMRSPMRERVLFVTGDTMARSTAEFLELHHLPCLAKPFLVEELKQAVNSRLFAASPASARQETKIPRRNP